VTRFPIRFEPWFRALSSALLILPSASYVEVDERDVVVRMAWAFRARFPRTAVKAVAPRSAWVLSRGVHGFNGRWLVNGSGDGLVTVHLEPAQRATVLGVPVRLRELVVSVEDSEALTAALLGQRE
jgi:hypothetical protein